MIPAIFRNKVKKYTNQNVVEFDGGCLIAIDNHMFPLTGEQDISCVPVFFQDDYFKIYA